jgi:hypothetical protein
VGGVGHQRYHRLRLSRLPALRKTNVDGEADAAEDQGEKQNKKDETRMPATCELMGPAP